MQTCSCASSPPTTPLITILLPFSASEKQIQDYQETEMCPTVVDKQGRQIPADCRGAVKQSTTDSLLCIHAQFEGEYILVNVRIAFYPDYGILQQHIYHQLQRTAIAKWRPVIGSSRLKAKWSHRWRSMKVPQCRKPEDGEENGNAAILVQAWCREELSKTV